MRRRAAALGLAVGSVLLASCAATDGGAAPAGSTVASTGASTSPSTSPSAGASTDASATTGTVGAATGRMVDVGNGRRMYLECAGVGSPTVILVSGLRTSAAEWHTTQSTATPPASPVFEEVARSTRVCAYDRPGTIVDDGPGRSDPVPQPTNAASAAADLHALLTAAGEQGPFLLVGHSIGGTVVRAFTAAHPGDVGGMVLIDPPSEFLQDAETPDQWAIQRRLMKVDAAEIADSVAEYPDIERFDIDATFATLRAAPSLPPIPLVVLSADELLAPQLPALIASGALPADTPPDFGPIFDAAQAKAQARLAQLTPDAVHITKTNSGHNIHLIQPQLVTDAVLQVAARMRATG